MGFYSDKYYAEILDLGPSPFLNSWVSEYCEALWEYMDKVSKAHWQHGRFHFDFSIEEMLGQEERKEGDHPKIRGNQNVCTSSVLVISEQMINWEEGKWMADCCGIQCDVGRGFRFRQTWVQIQATPLPAVWLWESLSFSKALHFQV